MLPYKKLSKKPRPLLPFAGATGQQFNVILKDVRRNRRKQEERRLSGRKRERAIGAGRRFDLELEDQLAMLLVRYRLHLTRELTGYLFGLDQSNAWRNTKYLEPAVKRSAPVPAKLHADSKKISGMQQLQLVTV